MKREGCGYRVGEPVEVVRGTHDGAGGSIMKLYAFTARVALMGLEQGTAVVPYEFLKPVDPRP